MIKALAKLGCLLIIGMILLVWVGWCFGTYIATH
jgi:hypothetical protein